MSTFLPFHSGFEFTLLIYSWFRIYELVLDSETIPYILEGQDLLTRSKDERINKILVGDCMKKIFRVKKEFRQIFESSNNSIRI